MKTRYYVIFAVIGVVALFPVISIVFYGAVPVGINTRYFENCEDCELYGCTNDEIYHRGICMTPEAKERAESVGETVEPEQYKTHPGLGLLNQDEQNNTEENKMHDNISGGIENED